MGLRGRSTATAPISSPSAPGRVRCASPHLRRVVRAAAGLRMEPSADGPRRRMEVHRGSATGAVSTLRSDPGENKQPRVGGDGARRRGRASASTRYSPARLERTAATRPDFAEALARACRRSAMSAAGGTGRDTRADPKDRREHRGAHRAGHVRGSCTARRSSARFATSSRGSRQSAGELRLGYVLLESGRCGDAIPRFARRDRARTCRRGRAPRARRVRAQARRPRGRGRCAPRTGAEPGNPVVLANLGMRVVGLRPRGRRYRPSRSVRSSLDPDFHQARFNLAVAYARGRTARGRRPRRRRNCCADCRPALRSALKSSDSSQA